MTVDTELLAAMPLFEGVRRRSLDGLLRAGTVRRFAAGEAVMTIGEPAGCALLVLSGALGVVLPEGTGSRVVGAVVSGEVAGETALLNPGRRRGASVVALEESLCLELRPALMVEQAQNPAVIAIEKHLLCDLAQRIRRSNKNIQRALADEHDPRPLPERLRAAVETELP